MLQFQSPCMQMNGSVLIASWRSIFKVTFYRTTHFRKLNSNLVMSSRLWIDFKKGVPIGCTKYFVVQLHVLGVFRLVIECFAWFLLSELRFSSRLMTDLCLPMERAMSFCVYPSLFIHEMVYLCSWVICAIQLLFWRFEAVRQFDPSKHEGGELPSFCFEKSMETLQI